MVDLTQKPFGLIAGDHIHYRIRGNSIYGNGVWTTNKFSKQLYTKPGLPPPPTINKLSRHGFLVCWQSPTQQALKELKQQFKFFLHWN